MKIAIPYENGQVFQHFGHSAQFKLYTAEEGRITGAEVVSTDGQGHGALVGFLVRSGVNVLLCGGIGGGAQMALAQAGIRLCGGITGNADSAATEQYFFMAQPDLRVRLCSFYVQHTKNIS